MSRAFGRWGRQIGPSRLDTMETSQHPASSSQQNSAYHRYVDTIIFRARDHQNPHYDLEYAWKRPDG